MLIPQFHAVWRQAGHPEINAIDQSTGLKMEFNTRRSVPPLSPQTLIILLTWNLSYWTAEPTLWTLKFWGIHFRDPLQYLNYKTSILDGFLELARSCNPEKAVGVWCRSKRKAVRLSVIPRAIIFFEPWLGKRRPTPDWLAFFFSQSGDITSGSESKDWLGSETRIQDKRKWTITFTHTSMWTKMIAEVSFLPSHRMVVDDRKELLCRAEIMNRVYLRDIAELDADISRLERLLAKEELDTTPAERLDTVSWFSLGHINRELERRGPF